jgi:NAD(P)-dependent dehydrogenase (short-subunit alcohol dehydrogenase family)
VKDVAGKTAFITGGASGIGLGIAAVFVNAGMNVVLADLRPDHIETALARFARCDQLRSVHAIHLDVTDRAAMAAAAQETEHVFGRLHVLVNNAGVGIEGPMNLARYDDWDFGMDVNLGGVINGIQTFLPRIRAHGEGGHVVNTASLAALITMPASMLMYVAAKAAVVALSESIRTQLAAEKIGVSVLCPGPVKSNIQQVARNRPERFRNCSGFGEAEAEFARRVVSPLWMEPEEVGAMVMKAVCENELYVITHGEWRQMVAARFEAILAAMPEHVNPDLIATLRSRAAG